MSRPVVDLRQVLQRGRPSSGLLKYTRTKTGVLLSTISFLLATILPTVIYGPTVLVLNFLGILSHFHMRRFMDTCIGSWLTFVTIVFERVLGIRTRIFGYRGRFKKRCVFIMNHVSHLDWLYFWTAVREQGDLTTWKVVTKNNIRKLPIFGHCMQYACLLFIERNWESDESEFRDKLDYFNSLEYPCQMLLFPEGGDITNKSMQKSDTYANEQGLPQYKYCLHPRTKGFTYILNKLREQGVDAVYDVTIAFPDNLPKTEGNVFGGLIPHTVDFHVKSFDDSDIPKDDEGIGKWCQERWQEKEELLHSYYTNSTFETSTGTSSKKSQSTKNDSTSWSQSTFMLWMLGVNVIAAYLAYVSWGVCIFAVLSTVFTFWLSSYSIGFDGLLLKIHKKATSEYLSRKMSQNNVTNCGKKKL